MLRWRGKLFNNNDFSLQLLYAADGHLLYILLKKETKKVTGFQQHEWVYDRISVISWSIPLRDEETWHRNHLICSPLLLHLHRNMNLRSLQAVWNLDIILVWLTVRSGVEVDCLWPCRRCSKSSVTSHDLKTTIIPACCINEFNSIP